MSQSEPSAPRAPDTAALDPAAPQDVIEPLAVGALLLDRYTVTAVLAANGRANIYRVAAMQRCGVCNVENDGLAGTCGYCGTALPPAPTRRVVEQRAPAQPAQLPPASFLHDGNLYSFVRDSDQDIVVPSLTWHMRCAYQTDPGVKRGAAGEPNQDALGVFQLAARNADGAFSVGLFMVADGIGGAQAGQEASRLALQTLYNELHAELVSPLWNQGAPADDAIRSTLRQAIAKTNTHVMQWANANALRSGTTLTLALVIGERAYVANLGDSRTYLARGGSLEQITTDHSFIAQLVANGSVTADEAYNHPRRNIILKSLGDPTGYQADIFPADGGALNLRAGDRLLLCSDGLWEMVRESDIVQVLTDNPDPQAACAQLVSLANLAGGLDNISVILVALDSF
jgi:serine/threonine protein phosphatase PrpC